MDDRPVSPSTQVGAVALTPERPDATLRRPQSLRQSLQSTGAKGLGEPTMRVRDGMSTTVLSVGPGHSLREAARLMSGRRVGAAIVLDPDGQGPGIITERDVLDAIGAGQDPDAERVRDHLTADVVFAAPDWSLEEAAVAMVRGRFRHLIVTEGGE